MAKTVQNKLLSLTIDFLAKSRIEVLKAANKLADDIDMAEVEAQSYDYYKKALSDGTHTAY